MKLNPIFKRKGIYSYRIIQFLFPIQSYSQILKIISSQVKVNMTWILLLSYPFPIKQKKQNKIYKYFWIDFTYRQQKKKVFFFDRVAYVTTTHLLSPHFTIHYVLHRNMNFAFIYIICLYNTFTQNFRSPTHPHTYTINIALYF